MRLLLIHSKASRCRFVAKFQEAGIDVNLAVSTESALKRVAAVWHDAIILDAEFHKPNSLSLLSDLRVRGNGAPVLVIRARGRLPDPENAVWAGADDHVVLPIAFGELIARIRRLLHQPAVDGHQSIGLDNLSLDVSQPVARIGGKAVVLPIREADILRVLLKEGGRIVSKVSINRHLFGPNASSLNAVEVYVHRLRRRLASAGANLKICTAYGTGYFVAVQQ